MKITINILFRTTATLLAFSFFSLFGPVLDADIVVGGNPQITIFSPSPINDEQVLTPPPTLSFNVSETGGNDIDVSIYASLDSTRLNDSGGLVYSRTVPSNSDISFDLSSIPVAPDNNLALLMHFDNKVGFGESGSFVFDFTEKGNDGIPKDDAPTNADGDTPPVPDSEGGRYGGGYILDGIDDYIEVSDDPTLEFASDSFSIEAWIKPAVNDSNTLMGIVGKSALDRTGPNYKIIYFRGTIVASVVDNSIFRSFYGETTLNVNEWHYVVMVVDRSAETLAVYINGVLDSQHKEVSISGLGPIGNNEPLLIGRYASYFFEGAVDEVAIWNRALSSFEINDRYNIGNGRYYWKIEAKSASSVTETDNQSFIIPFFQAKPIYFVASPVSNSRINLMWNRPFYGSENLNVDHYDIYRNGVFLTQTGNNYYSDENLDENTTYNYQVASCTAEDICSPRSDEFSATTTSSSDALTIIPGGHGYGMTTTAGSSRGPLGDTQIIHVTNLNDSGPGSLREAIGAVGPRTVVFDVSGAINLNRRISIKNPYITIAGQTAPPPGISIFRGYSFYIETHDVLIQHVAVRLGDNGLGNDVLSILGSDDGTVEAYNIIIDHVSLSWSQDEIAEIYFGHTYDITFSHTILSEPLKNSYHSEGEHAYTFLIGRKSRNITILNNLFAHAEDRTPLMRATHGVVANNLRYNTGSGPNVALYDAPFRLEASFLSNVGIPGPEFDAWPSLFIHGMTDEARIFFLENPCDNGRNDPWSCAQNAFEGKIATPTLWPDSLNLLPLDQVAESVLANVGSRPAYRDIVDSRLISEVQSGTGHMVDCVAPGPRYYPTGTIDSSGTSLSTAKISSGAGPNGKYSGHKIEITGGTGTGQVRDITAYAGFGINTATISPDWDTVPDDTSSYRIIFDCSQNNNAGGWPVIAENTWELESTPWHLPEPDDPHGLNEDGYTNLEAWLHHLAAIVEGRKPIPDDYDFDGVVDSVDDFPNDATKATPKATTGIEKITIDTSSNAGTSLSRVTAISDSHVNQINKPTGYDFPDGMVSFQVKTPAAGDTVQVEITWPTRIPMGAKYFMVNATGFYLFPGAVISEYTVTLTLTDSPQPGSGDNDATENSIIVGLGGIATPPPDDSDFDGVVNSLDEFPFDATKATPEAATGTGTISIDAGSNSLSFVTAISDSDPGLNSTNKPTDYDFLDGLVSFQVNTPAPGDTIQVEINWPTPIPAGAKYYKVNASGFYSFEGAVITGDTVILTLTDGGPGDSDATENSVISDPGGIGTPSPSGGGSVGGKTVRVTTKTSCFISQLLE